MKKYLLIALAALGFTACTEAIDDAYDNVTNGELEEAYIAINLMSADKDTRAATDTYGYEEGTTAERKINTAYFFFFDAEGNPFNVNNAPATTPGGDKNHLSLAINAASTSGMPNVSDIKNAVLVLSTYKGVYPSKIVAVLNWTPENKAYSLDDLHDERNQNCITYRTMNSLCKSCFCTGWCDRFIDHSCMAKGCYFILSL